MHSVHLFLVSGGILPSAPFDPPALNFSSSYECFVLPLRVPYIVYKRSQTFTASPLNVCNCPNAAGADRGRWPASVVRLYTLRPNPKAPLPEPQMPLQICSRKRRTFLKTPPRSIRPRPSPPARLIAINELCDFRPYPFAPSIRALPCVLSTTRAASSPPCGLRRSASSSLQDNLLTEPRH